MIIDDHEMVVQSLGRVLEIEDDIEVIATAHSVGEGTLTRLQHATVPERRPRDR
jgi:DNA-binding NarL/FixJ family response regulator